MAAPVAEAEAAVAARRETMEAAGEERPEEGRLPEDSAVDPATSWEGTPVRKGKLRISVIPLFFHFSLFFCPNLGKFLDEKILPIGCFVLFFPQRNANTSLKIFSLRTPAE